MLDTTLKDKVMDVISSGLEDSRTCDSNEELLEEIHWLTTALAVIKEELETLEDRRLGAGMGYYKEDY